MPTNEFGQAIGETLEEYCPPLPPTSASIQGNFCILEKISLKHFDDLYRNVYGPESSDEYWTYLPLEKFSDQKDFKNYFSTLISSKDPYFFAIIDTRNGEAVGCFALMRINIECGSVEVGFVMYSERLKRTRIATEAQFLLARYVFEELNYRRFEWKCDSLNAPSRKAALRLGFKYEGTFRQALVYKNRNRDTSWFSIIDKEWPDLKVRFQNWLSESNFDEHGNQILPLNDTVSEIQ